MAQAGYKMLFLEHVPVEIIGSETESEDILHGNVKLFGVLHSVTFIRVVEHDGLHVCEDDTLGQIDALREYHPAGKWLTVQLPDMDGDWVVVIHPHDDDQ